MPRYTNPSLWDRDWFLDLKGKYQHFCMYLRDHCNHAGIWQPSFKRFEQSTGFRININDYLSRVNKDGSIRVLVLDNGKWWIVGFIEDQLPGILLRLNNNYHKGIINSLEANCVPYLSYGYKLDSPMTHISPTGGSQDKEKDIDKDTVIFPLIQEGMQWEKPPEPEKPQSKIIPPKREWVKKYCEDRENGIDPDSFFDHYETRGWIPKGATKQMKDWQAAIRTWEKFKKENGNNKADETRWKFLEGK